jgi:hypothetical protein
VNTEPAGEKLANRHSASAAVSGGSHDAEIYTNDKTSLAGAVRQLV